MRDQNSAHGKGPLLGFCASMCEFQAGPGARLNRSAPQPTVTTGRPVPRAVADRNIWWFAETTG